MAQHAGIIVKHTADRMKAYIALAKNMGPYSAGVVLTELLQHGVVHGLNTAVIHKIIAAGMFEKYVEVAAGTPVVPGTDGRVEVTQSPPPDESGEEGAALARPVNFVKVKAGDVLARRVPPVPGKNGMDVFGGAIPAPQVKDAQLLGGKGTVMKPDKPDLLLAEYDGTYYQKPAGEIEVRPFRNIDGYLGGEAGGLAFEGDLQIDGAVMPGASVEASGALVIKGVVQDAAVKCGGDLTLQSAVIGGPRAMIKCGGRVWANSLEKTAVASDGGIVVAEDVIDCDITCNGALKARVIAGGSVTAAGGVSAHQIGSDAGTHTVVDVSTMHNYVKKIDAIKNSIELQNTQSDGYISDLYRFVRNSMDEFGEIPEDKAGMLGGYIKNLTESVTLGVSMGKDLEDLIAALKTMSDCSVNAREVYPNVQIKLGFSEQNVTALTKNVILKPAAVKIGENL
jgi:uncharacterized protein (DUF342 family)